MTLAVLLILLIPAMISAQSSQSTCVRSPDMPSPGMPASDDAVILNVCNNERGMAPLPQPRLYFRLYRSGRLEYEVNPEADYVTGRQEISLLLKHTEIDSSQVDEVIRLGRMADFQNADPVYRAFQSWVDSSLESTITFTDQGQSKTIAVHNPNPTDPLNHSHYPASLLAMMLKIWELRPADHPPTLRDIFINQPDYLATESYTSSFMGHGFSTTYRTAKRWDCYRRQSSSQVVYSCLNQPDQVYYPKTREYQIEPVRKGAGAIFASDVQTFARMEKDVEYKLIGTAMIGEQECRKIEAKITYQNAAGSAEDFIYVFYVAKNLRDMVLGVDVTGRDSYTSSRLSNVVLDFPDKLFAKPRGYRLKR